MIDIPINDEEQDISAENLRIVGEVLDAECQVDQHDHDHRHDVNTLESKV